MKVLASMCLLLALLSPGAAKFSDGEPYLCSKCYGDCKSKRTAYCSFIKVRSCYSKILDFPMEDLRKDQTMDNELGCMPKEDCHPYTYTASLVDNGYIYGEQQCCRKTACNKPLTVPKQEERPVNGMECLGCLITGSNNTELCSGQTVIKCRGHENKCMGYIGTFDNPSYFNKRFNFRACASKNLCDLLMGVDSQEVYLLRPGQIKLAQCDPAEYPAEG